MSNPRIRKRNKFQRQEELSKIALLHSQGMSQRQIAKAFGLSQSQISKDLKEIRKRGLEVLVPNGSRSLADVWARIEELLKECFEAWLASKEPKETSFRVMTKYAGSATKRPKMREKASLRTESRCGTPSLIAQYRALLQMQLEILGLEEGLPEPKGPVPQLKIIDCREPRPKAGANGPEVSQGTANLNNSAAA